MSKTKKPTSAKKQVINGITHETMFFAERKQTLTLRLRQAVGKSGVRCSSR